MKLYRIREKDYAEAESFLSMRQKEKWYDTIETIESPKQVSLSDLIHMLESEAENANYHHLMDAFQLIANLVDTYTGSSDIAKKVMWGIAEHGGLIQ